MGETSTSFMPSFSTSADTCCVVQQGDPMQMLGESISFGRFMTENLDWGKWSTFSHQRYVEEAQKYSKPGSVAAKKAYFEAYYKKKATERAAALIQEANVQANGTFDSETQEATCIYSSNETISKEDNIVTKNEQIDDKAVNFHIVDSADTNQNKCQVGQSDLDISYVEGAEDVPHPQIDTNLKMESCLLIDDSNQFDNVVVHKNVAIPVEEKMPAPGLVGEEVLALPVKGKEVNSSPKLSTKTGYAKLSHSLDRRKAAAILPPRNAINNGSKIKFVGDAVEKKRPTARSLHMSINLPSGTSQTSKTTAASLQSRNGLNSFSTNKKSIGSLVEKKRTTAPSLYSSINLSSGVGMSSKTTTAAVKPRNNINFASSIISVGDAVEKKRPTVRSLHMSINLPSGTSETSKTTAASLQSRNGLNSFSTNKKSIGSSVEKKKTTAPSLYSSINLSSGVGVSSKTTTAAVKPRNNITFASKILKSAGDSVERRPTARSLHMSINLSSGAGETSERPLPSEHNRIKKIHSNLPKDYPVTSQTSKKASHHLLNQASAKPPSQGIRTERLLNKFVSGCVATNAKLSSSSDCLKSSSTSKTIPRSPTLSSPFRFRSEERAAKRKEFLQQMDETRSKAEEKVQLPRTPKGKTEYDQKKLYQSSGSRSKLNEDKPSGSQSPSNHQIRKISLMVPGSPKPGRKVSSSTLHDKNLRNSWKPPVNTNNNSKRITKKIIQTRQSGTSSSNTTRENASPNIQH